MVAAGLLCNSAPVLAQAAQAAQPAQAAPHDGAHDFDWEVGAWDTQVRVRAPLSTAENWTAFHGASIVHGFSNNRANLVDLSVASASGVHIEGVSLRLYNPQTQQWTLNFASMRAGVLTPPVYGGFVGGRGEFYGADTVDGRSVLVRFVISDINANSAHFEQAFSTDGGRTWIANWIAIDTRRR